MNALHAAPDPAPQPAPAEPSRQVLGLSRLIQIEGDLRQADSVTAVDFISVNDTNRVVGYDHAMVWRSRTQAIMAISGGLTVDRSAPQIGWFAKLARHAEKHLDCTDAIEFATSDLPLGLVEGYRRWVPATAIWVPITGPHKGLEGSLILLRAEPFTEAEKRILLRLGSAIGQAIVALQGPRSRLRLSMAPLGALGFAALAALGLVPVPLTVLADAKVTPIEPSIVAAPIDGVIQDILVQPNEQVEPGRVLVRLDTTELFAQRDGAAKHVSVLTADWQRLEQKAFTDDRARAEVSVARSRLAEGESDLAYATSRLGRAEIVARATGVVLLEDKLQWLGRPVKVGERILSLADPKAVRLEIQVPVEDALVVNAGAQVEFFLAISPSRPVRAQLSRISYDAHVMPNQMTAFIGEAVFDESGEQPRLGLTGTAKISGETVPLAYALLRRPLAHLRRVLGF